jgi:hypothetical protein
MVAIGRREQQQPVLVDLEAEVAQALAADRRAFGVENGIVDRQLVDVA